MIPRTSAAIPRALTDRFDRHSLWLAAGLVVAFLGAMLSTVALVETRRAAPTARVVTTTITTGAWRTTHHRVVITPAARIRPDVLIW